jgi:uncharacterized protein HemX
MRNLTLLLVIALLPWISCASHEPATSGQDNRESETARQQRSEFQEKSEAELRELSRKINDLNSKASGQSEHARKELAREMAELDRKRDAVQQQLQKLQTSTRQAWRDAKPGIDAAMKDLEDAYKRAAADFK